MKDFVINYYLQAKLSVCRAEVIFSVSSLVTRSSSFADHRETSKLSWHSVSRHKGVNFGDHVSTT